MPHRPLALIVDDEPNIRLTLRQQLESETLHVVVAATVRDALEIIRATPPDVVLLDVRLPDMSGLDACSRIHEMDPLVPVVIMTAFARTDVAIEATRRGAFDYLIKPLDLKQLRDIVGKAVQVSRLRRVPAIVPSPDQSAAGDADLIVGNSPPMQEVYKFIGRVASNDAPVLIMGESGTGKELVARAVFHYSKRRDKPFLAINCAAISEALLESELFGHERGAFTGAEQRRIGKFEQVNGGTILLDEIGDMSPATQAKALRLLQQQQFERVGGNTTIQTDVRIIAATNRNLPEMVEAGLFRRDLFYRLNVFTIQLPPLRQRPQDIPELTLAFLRQITQQTGRAFRHVTPEALAALQQHDWPGNVRELESAVKFAAAHCTGDVITPDCLPEVCRTRFPDQQQQQRTADAQAVLDIAALTKQLLEAGSTNVYREVSSHVDRVLLSTVLNHAGGNLQQAAEMLGISRMTLRARLKQSHHDSTEKLNPDDEAGRHEPTDTDSAAGPG
ncbi:sigma-54-dependent Fis family transcriptional regulator [Planctomycetia bacterium]|nr:sigma-54-dependent Fis family transcriptional regulator [Planctomycetia bacterium]